MRVTFITHFCCVTICAGAVQSGENIVQLAQKINSLSTLVTALKAGNLVTALQGEGPFTVFAPSNAAFNKLPDAALQRLLDPQNVGELVGILTYHVLPGSAVYSEDIKSTQKMTTLQGQDLLITSYSGVGVMIVGNSKVTVADKAATNGVVYIIDTVLMPPPIVTTPAPPMPTEDIVQLAQGSADLSTLVSALQVGDLLIALQGKGPFTVFAPSDTAFRKLPKTVLDRLLEPQNKEELVGILTYHVLSGLAIYSKDLRPSQKFTTLQGQDVLVTSFSAAGVSINGNSKVTAADNAAKNGVVHIIDTVLMPPKIRAPIQQNKIKTSAEPTRGKRDIKVY